MISLYYHFNIILVFQIIILVFFDAGREKNGWNMGKSLVREAIQFSSSSIDKTEVKFSTNII